MDENDLSDSSMLSRHLESWSSLSHEERVERFRSVPRDQAEDLFLALSSVDQAELLLELRPAERRSWVRLLAPDDAADMIQALPETTRPEVLDLLDVSTHLEVDALMAYAEDEAGGLMSSRYIRLRPDMTAEVAVRYLRVQLRKSVATARYAYVIGHDQKLLGVVSLRELFLAHPDEIIHEVMSQDLVMLPEDMDQEEVGRRFSTYDLNAIPVVDDEGRMKGVVTVDDIVSVVQEEATEDIQKMGATEALEEPYLRTSFLKMLRKRVVWLVLLFVGGMFTATAMKHYAHDIERIVVLAVFIPLIISSGGNSGSQASTLIVRALALREIRLRDWYRVLFRELLTGLSLGIILGVIGLLRVLWGPASLADADQNFLLSVTVGLALVGVVFWGSIVGSMLPFLLKILRLDPAMASAPMVATIVDVTGLIIYFTVASAMLTEHFL